MVLDSDPGLDRELRLRDKSHFFFFFESFWFPHKQLKHSCAAVCNTKSCLCRCKYDYSAKALPTELQVQRAQLSRKTQGKRDQKLLKACPQGLILLLVKAQALISQASSSEQGGRGPALWKASWSPWQRHISF